jgi:hypothetical protein
LVSGPPHATAARFGLGFPAAPGLLSLNLAAYGDSQAHSTKGTPSPSRALTACRSTVSGSLSLPSRGPFHRSLTVLCAIGSRRVFSLGGWSPRIPAGFPVSRRTQVSRPCRPQRFAYGAFTLSGGPSQTLPLRCGFVTARAKAPPRPYNPRRHARGFGLFPVRSPLLGESRLISSPVGTQMVHFPTCGPHALSIGACVHGIRPCGLPHSDIRASQGIGPYTRLFAACHVLLRLAAPRHPPWTLIHLTMSLLLSFAIICLLDKYSVKKPAA